jgi:hypothetical protein
MPKNITFDQLRAVMASRAGRPGLPSKKSMGNARSALVGLVRALQLDMEAKVGATLREDFKASLDEFRGQLRRLNRGRQSINNKAASLKQWATLVRILDHEGALQADTRTPFQQKLDQMFETRKDMFRLAAQAGLSWRTLRNWKTRGAMPKSTSDGNLVRLAIVSGLDPDALTKLLPPAIGRFPVQTIEVMSIPSRTRNTALASKKENRYLVRPKQATEAFKTEWRGLLIHKVPAAKGMDDTEDPQAKLGVRQLVRAAMKSDPEDSDRVWRLRPVEDYPTDHPAWINTVGGQVAPSADINYRHVSAFLGWARLPVERGGKAMPDEKLSMGLLVNTKLLEEFLEWRAVRSDAVNAGLMGFIASVRSYCRPKTGYLWASKAIGKTMGKSETAWRARCKATNDWLALKMEQLRPLLEQSRDPAAPLKPLLDMPRPLQGYRDAINRYASQVRPTPLLRATQARDLALLAVSISNPLRLTNLRLLTYKPDGSGHFRKTARGTWEVFVPRIEFKNIRGAAKDRDYHMPLSEMAAHFLEEYLEKHWQLLGGAGQRGLVFISTGKPDEVWEDLDCQYAKVTSDCLRVLGCPSIRPHATRYLVGTAILMATQGNVELAAAALHDKKETVEKHYSKLLASYASRGVHAAIGRDLSFGFDEKVAGLVPIPYIEPDTKE